jgi:hypothetical protein
MTVDQRNAGIAQNITTANVYSVDRWLCAASTTVSGTLTVQRLLTSSIGSQYAIRIARTSGSYVGSLVIGQIIETLNCYDLAGQTVTLSFKARKGSAYSAAITANIHTGTASNEGNAGFTGSSWTGFATAGTTTVSNATLTTSFQTFSVSCSIGSSVQEIGLYFTTGAFTGTGAANDYIEITDVQLELGSAVTPYERQIYSDQLAQCQRYYYVGPICAYGFPSPNSGGYAAVQRYDFKVTMRTAPTVTTTYTSLTNVSTINASTRTSDFFVDQIVSSTTTNTTWVLYYTTSAEL